MIKATFFHLKFSKTGDFSHGYNKGTARNRVGEKGRLGIRLEY